MEVPGEESPWPAVATPATVVEPREPRFDLAELAWQRAVIPVQANPPEPPTRPPDPVQPTAAALAESRPEVPVVVPGENPAPDYPDAAVRRRLEGTALVRIEVAPDGTVADCRIATSSGSGLLDEAALAAARRWRFQRGPGAVEVPFVFRLRNRS